MKKIENTFVKFREEFCSFLGSGPLIDGDKKIYELIFKYCAENNSNKNKKKDKSNFLRNMFDPFICRSNYTDPSRVIQEVFNIINKYYGESYQMYLPVFIRKNKVYSFLLIIMLTIEELEFLLLGQRDYQLIAKETTSFIPSRKKIEDDIQSLFGDEIKLLENNSPLLSLMNIDNKDSFFEIFNQFESLIFHFLFEHRLDKSDFYEDLYIYLMWDYEDDCPYIPVTFFLSLPYSLIYETILSGVDPMKKLTVSEVIIQN